MVKKYCYLPSIVIRLFALLSYYLSYHVSYICKYVLKGLAKATRVINTILTDCAGEGFKS